MQEIRDELERRLTKPVGVEQFLKVPTTAKLEPVPLEPVPLEPVPPNQPHPSGLNRKVHSDQEPTGCAPEAGAAVTDGEPDLEPDRSEPEPTPTAPREAAGEAPPTLQSHPTSRGSPPRGGGAPSSGRPSSVEANVAPAGDTSPPTEEERAPAREPATTPASAVQHEEDGHEPVASGGGAAVEESPAPAQAAEPASDPALEERARYAERVRAARDARGWRNRDLARAVAEHTGRMPASCEAATSKAAGHGEAVSWLREALEQVLFRSDGPEEPGSPEVTVEPGQEADPEEVQLLEPRAWRTQRIDEHDITVRAMNVAANAGWQTVADIPLDDATILRVSGVNRKVLHELRRLTHPATLQEARTAAIVEERNRARAAVHVEHEELRRLVAGRHAAELDELRRHLAEARARSEDAARVAGELDALRRALHAALGEADQFADAVLVESVREMRFASVTTTDEIAHVHRTFDAVGVGEAMSLEERCEYLKGALLGLRKPA